MALLKCCVGLECALQRRQSNIIYVQSVLYSLAVEETNIYSIAQQGRTVGPLPLLAKTAGLQCSASNIIQDQSVLYSLAIEETSIYSIAQQGRAVGPLPLQTIYTIQIMCNSITMQYIMYAIQRGFISVCTVIKRFPNGLFKTFYL